MDQILENLSRKFAYSLGLPHPPFPSLPSAPLLSPLQMSSLYGHGADHTEPATEPATKPAATEVAAT